VGVYLRRAGAPYILLAMFVVMMTAGLLWGGYGKVLAHGIVICLDCIGLF
jgi:hypothetical protein